MSPIYHTTVSLGLGVIIAKFFHSWTAGALCLLSGVFIDLDHHLDFWIARKKIPWRYRDLVEFCEEPRTGKVYLWLHGYELLIALWAAITIFHLDIHWIAFAIGLTVHLICDQFTNPIRPLFYFYVYRFIKKFERRLVLAPGN